MRLAEWVPAVDTPPMRNAVLGTLLASAVLLGSGCDEKGTCKGVITGSSDQCVVNQTKARCDEDKGTFTKEGSAEGLRSCETAGYTKSGSLSAGDARKQAEAGQPTYFNK